MRHYCTLWDINYCAKGLALHASLLKHSSEDFTLHILCMDKETFWILAEMELPHVELIPLESFEKALKLQPVRESRTWQEYCWTCASSLMELLLPSFDGITYLDADLYFYSDPKVIYEEVAEKSIGIVSHRFNERDRKRFGGNGEFNVGVIVANGSQTALHCITRWAMQSREWCFNRNEAGKFGDQAYLDSWPKDYPGEVCVIENLGVNLGPWSVGNFEIENYLNITTMQDVLLVIDGVRADPLVCYHMHEFRDASYLTGWKLRESDRKLIYLPYVRVFNEMQERIKVVKVRMMARREEVLQQAGRA